MMQTLVRFKDGTEVTGHWNPAYFRPGVALSQAVASAEAARGEPHDGAWLEFGPERKPAEPSP